MANDLYWKATRVKIRDKTTQYEATQDDTRQHKATRDNTRRHDTTQDNTRTTRDNTRRHKTPRGEQKKLETTRVEFFWFRNLFDSRTLQTFLRDEKKIGVINHRNQYQTIESH